jgi:hypothetical protein
VIARIAGLLACVAFVSAYAGPAEAAPAQPPPPPQRILLVGDSTAVTLFPFLRDAGATRGSPISSWGCWSAPRRRLRRHHVRRRRSATA